MKNQKRILLSILLTSLLIAFAPSSHANEGEGNYNERVKTKALSGLANIGSGILEIPKNMINISNDTNFVWGVLGGAPYGGLIMAGRMVSGLADLATCFIPTTPITNPVYVWDDFDKNTTFGDGLRLEDR
jgi:putative exosortase-associated protein (TIGR04073 family)